jgi:hypothetical protein
MVVKGARPGGVVRTLDCENRSRRQSVKDLGGKLLLDKKGGDLYGYYGQHRGRERANEKQKALNQGCAAVGEEL